jgi:uncharacterized protein VirK/YbjX
MSIDLLVELASDKYYWWPPRLVRILWSLATNIGTQRAIFRLLSQPAFKRVVAEDPRFLFKYLTRNYLVRGLSVADRATCFMHHYSTLIERFPEENRRQILHDNVSLIKIAEGETNVSILMGLSKTEVREGELRLSLHVNGSIVYVLQFTIVPGKVLGCSAKSVLLVSRLQGVKGCYQKVKLATKTCNDVSPPALLFTALQGIAEGNQIDKIAGVSARDQFSYHEDFSKIFAEAYDGFFEEHGGIRTESNLYFIELPLQEKPLEQVPEGHKLRTKKKRAFKAKIREIVRSELRNMIDARSPVEIGMTSQSSPISLQGKTNLEKV